MKRYCLYLFILIGISCSAELKAQKNGTVYKGNDPAVRYTGRTLVSPDGSVAFDWGRHLSGNPLYWWKAVSESF